MPRNFYFGKDANVVTGSANFASLIATGFATYGLTSAQSVAFGLLNTALQSSFGIIMLAIVGGRPKVLSLVELIDNFIEFRREIVRRRTEFELRKAEARRHILEGLKIALDHLDAVIALIRAAKSPGEARDGLMTQFSLTQIQAQEPVIWIFST